MDNESLREKFANFCTWRPLNWQKVDHGPLFNKILHQGPLSEQNFAFDVLLQQVYGTYYQNTLGIVLLMEGITMKNKLFHFL